MKIRISILVALVLVVISSLNAKEPDTFPTQAPSATSISSLDLKSNLLPWIMTIPNLGAEYKFANKWSVSLDVWYCPWKLTDRFSVKTAALLPEGRWWFKSNKKGSFLNLHLTVAWYNVRANAYRYQDRGRPLVGAGIGYGYRLPLNQRWGLEFEIGAGMANMKYARYYNVPNGALKDIRVSTYWGIDRLSIAATYYLSDL